MLDVDVQLRRPPLAMEFAFRTESTITGVFGRSGAGKTTLLHLVAGLRRPTAGTIRIDDEVLYDGARGIDRPVHRRRLGVVFQDDRLFPHLRVAANLRYGRPRDAGRLRVDEVVELLDLGRLLARRVEGLSGGERQRVALGRVLLSEPRLLLLDEPLSSLDRVHRREIIGLIRRVRDELALPMLYVTHDLTELLQLTERVIIVEGGRSVGHGRLRDLVREETPWRVVRDLGPLNVLELTVRGHDRAAGLTRLEGPAGAEASPALTLAAPLLDRAPGTRVHVSIRPEDVALARHEIDGISIQNQIPARVRRVIAHPDRALAELDVGAPLLAEISHKTVHDMELAPGRAVRCLVKSNAIRYIDGDPEGTTS